MLNKPKYILFILTIAFSLLTVGNVALFYFHIEEQDVFVWVTLATCSFSSVSLLYLFFHFKSNYISKRVIEDENGEVDIKKLKAEIEKAQKEKALQLRKKHFEETLIKHKHHTGFEDFVTKQLARDMEACTAAYFVTDTQDGAEVLKLTSSYAFSIPENGLVIPFGEGLTGQVAAEKKLMNVKNVPEGYIMTESGLGKITPPYMIIVPFFENGKVKGVLELASFKEYSVEDEKFLAHISEIA